MNKNNFQAFLRSGQLIPYFDGSNDDRIHSREFLNTLVAVANAVLATKNWIVTENGILFTPGTSNASLVVEQYNPARAGGYPANSIVVFTPDGDFARTFWSLQQVPAGIAPDTGAPYWSDLPSSPAGVWA